MSLIKIAYILLLAAAAIEDTKHHRVDKIYSILLLVIGCIQMYTIQEGRWVSLALTCICFLVLYGLYGLVLVWSKHRKRKISFGGADVRLIPGMMLVQGWDVALTGIFGGLTAAVVWTLVKKQWKEEIPLVPWMSVGCIVMEILVLIR